VQRQRIRQPHRPACCSRSSGAARPASQDPAGGLRGADRRGEGFLSERRADAGTARDRDGRGASSLDFEAAAMLRDSNPRAVDGAATRTSIRRASTTLTSSPPIQAAEYLRPGCFFFAAGRTGKPRLFPEPRPAASGRGGADQLRRAVLRQPAQAAAGAVEHQLVSRRWSPELCVAGRTQVERAGAASGTKEAHRAAFQQPRARRSAAVSPKSSTQRQLIDCVAAALGCRGR